MISVEMWTGRERGGRERAGARLPGPRRGAHERPGRRHRRKPAPGAGAPESGAGLASPVLGLLQEPATRFRHRFVAGARSDVGGREPGARTPTSDPADVPHNHVGVTSQPVSSASAASTPA